MANVFLIDADGASWPLSRVRCKDEDAELQRILERNHDLLPGDQIDPENPRRWMLIKREMAVPDPSSGTDRWSVDFFFADQDAIPTLVECKRFDDTRARREVVGQMLDYAANGAHYWDKTLLRDLAEKSAAARGSSLEATLQDLSPTNEDSADAFFDRLQQNLREGKLRIVFFLEESSMELRSIVDFLNKQMELSEVLLVEARQYAKDAMRIVVPMLFGYTEEARIAKRAVTVATGRGKRQWNSATFFEELQKSVGEAQAAVIRAFWDKAEQLGCEGVWGTGATRGSLSIKLPAVHSKAILYLSTDGSLSLNFGYFSGSADAVTIRERLKQLLQEKTGLSIPADYEKRFPAFAVAKWVPSASGLLEVFIALLESAKQSALLTDPPIRA